MTQYTSPVRAVAASCACIQPSVIRNFQRPLVAARRPTPEALPNRGDAPTACLASASNVQDVSCPKPVPAWQADRIGEAGVAKTADSPAPTQKLCLQLPTTTLLKQHALFRQGEPADAVFYIIAGQVHRVVTTENGSDRLLSILGPDDFCGEECLTAQAWHSTSAITIEECKIIRIEKAAMLRLLHESPAFSDVFTTFLLSRKLKTEAALIDQLVGSVEQRLRRVLLALAAIRLGDSGIGIVPNAKQEMLAALVGTTRPRINHFLNKFRRLGLIEYGRGRPVGEIRILTALQQIDDRDCP